MSDGLERDEQPQVGQREREPRSSHRLNCGEYTLFDSRNTTRIGNPSVHRGKPGSRRALTIQIDRDPSR